jgi:hypothetical protein
MAARKVADENKKLRAMLAHNGIDNDSIELFLTTSPTTAGMDYVQYGSTTSDSVQILEDSLKLRRKCCTDMSVHTTKAVVARNNSPEHGLGTVESPCNAATFPELGRMSISRSGKSITSSGTFMIQTSTQDRTRGLDGRAHHSLPHNQPRIAPYVQQVPRNLVPISASSDSQTANIISQYSSQALNYNSFPVDSLRENCVPIQHNPQGFSAYVPTTTRNRNVNSCSNAADMITTMAGADPASVRADLGCLPDTDCDVDNQIVFEVMDRYSGRAGI